MNVLTFHERGVRRVANNSIFWVQIWPVFLQGVPKNDKILTSLLSLSQTIFDLVIHEVHHMRVSTMGKIIPLTSIAKTVAIFPKHTFFSDLFFVNFMKIREIPWYIFSVIKFKILVIRRKVNPF